MLEVGIQTLRDYELFCEGRLDDPYPLYRRLREEDPIHWSERLGGWIVTRYDDVLACLMDPRLGADRASAYIRALPEPQRTRLAPLGEYIANLLGFMDPPKHTRMRRLVGKVFTPKLMESMRDRILAMVNMLLDRVEPTGRMDIVKDFGFPLPDLVICEILGIQADAQSQFKIWADDIAAFVSSFGPSLAQKADRANKSREELAAFFRGLVLDRRRQPTGDLISALAALEGEGEGLTEQELLASCAFLFGAGEHTLVGLIGNGMLLLMRNRDQMELLKKQPELTESAVEEFLRYESPIQISPRLAVEDIEFRNRVFRKGEAVLLVGAAANRDPAKFTDPDRLDVCGKENRQLAFGWGTHFCLGAPLARLEGQLAFKILLERFPNIRLQSEGVEWKENLSMRILESLPVVF